MGCQQAKQQKKNNQLKVVKLQFQKADTYEQPTPGKKFESYLLDQNFDFDFSPQNEKNISMTTKSSNHNNVFNFSNEQQTQQQQNNNNNNNNQDIFYSDCDLQEMDENVVNQKKQQKNNHLQKSEFVPCHLQNTKKIDQINRIKASSIGNLNNNNNNQKYNSLQQQQQNITSQIISNNNKIGINTNNYNIKLPTSADYFYLPEKCQKDIEEFKKFCYQEQIKEQKQNKVDLFPVYTAIQSSLNGETITIQTKHQSSLFKRRQRLNTY